VGAVDPPAPTLATPPDVARARPLGSSETARPNRLNAALGLRAAGLCVLGLALVWVLAELVPALRLRDVLALHAFTKLDSPRVDAIANYILALLDPVVYTFWALLLVAVALVRRRPRVALTVTIVLAGAPLAAEVLKPLMAHAHDHIGWVWIGAASWPSGHATAAMTLVLCALLVAPNRLRPTVAVLGCAYAVAVGLSLLILAWHLPSDVLGGYLLAALFGSLALASLRSAERRQARPEARWQGEDLLVPAVVVLAGTLAVAVGVLVRAGQVASFASDHHLMVAAATAIAALAALIAAGLTLALRS
jgi:membrane-associated phospholipid phosphatase